jgi:hypothetical protein
MAKIWQARKVDSIYSHTHDTAIWIHFFWRRNHRTDAMANVMRVAHHSQSFMYHHTSCFEQTMPAATTYCCDEESLVPKFGNNDQGQGGEERIHLRVRGMHTHHSK